MKRNLTTCSILVLVFLFVTNPALSLAEEMNFWIDDPPFRGDLVKAVNFAFDTLDKENPETSEKTARLIKINLMEACPKGRTRSYIIRVKNGSQAAFTAYPNADCRIKLNIFLK